jgi:hypothetical protein
VCDKLAQAILARNRKPIGDLMMRDTILTIDDIPVMYVAGTKGRPIPEQDPAAFRKLESNLPSLKGRRFYGVEVDDEYRACVGIIENDDRSSLPHPAWIIPGGKYVRRKIKNWEEHIDWIEPAYE